MDVNGQRPMLYPGGLLACAVAVVVVIAAASHPVAAGFERFRLDGGWRAACHPTDGEWCRRELARALARFSTGGRRVVVAVVPYPAAQWVPNDARQQIDCANALNRSVAAQVGAAVIDLEDLVCPNRRYIDRVDGSPLRGDGVHFGDNEVPWLADFRGNGAAYAARWLLRAISGLVAPGGG